MSKMKHLLRKLHIGNYNHHHRRMVVNEASPPSDSVSSESRAVDSSSSDRTVENERSRTNPRDFNFFEEEFQVQLALAISASDPEPQNDVELDQIKAAKQLSLGCSPSVPDNERLSEFLSLKYWNYNFIHYDEKIVDGFYDVYAIASNSIAQGEMPLFMDLQAISISGNMEYEVISVNRSVDFQLQHLENKAYAISVECKVLGCGLFLNSLIRRIADLVVDKMGGPVVNAEEMMKKWRFRSDELKTSLNTIILPLGCLDVGLSRHRALLFKVLADRINLPCTLVKGSLYTGIDDGAVNLIKIDGGEYIIDLMGAPGALVPAEIPSSLLLDAALEARDFPGSSATINNLSLVLDKVSGIHRIVPDSVEVPTESTMAEIQSTQDSEIFVWEKTKRSEQERKVKDVSEYVISAAKDPQFAQKLHAVLLESGATPPADLFLDMNPDILGEEKLIAPVQHVKRDIVDYVTSCCPETNWTEIMFGYDPEGAIQEPSREKSQLVESSNKESGFEDYEEHSMKNLNNDRGCETVKRSCLIACNGSDESVEPDASEKISPMLGEVAEWDIPWDDLQIGERIGIGSYGEVYRADWNGTEVAVKKFLVQDLTGDVLLQFKCEAEMMIRLRHPNVVLFMGAVTRPPNLSILTEFLPRGSLYKLLHRSSTCIDERRRMKMALDVARGMNYLHTGHPPIVHRDLKTPNLLVDKNWGVKVCDFGLSRLKHHTFLSSKSTAGTPEWMAPEVLRNEPSNEKSDVYSFGVILWELATLCMPWSGLNPMQVVGAVGFQNRRLDIPEEVDPMVAQIIRDCWENDPSLRPSFSEIMSRLKVLDRLIVPIN